MFTLLLSVVICFICLWMFGKARRWLKSVTSPYATTKPYRRVAGILAELWIISAFFLLTGLLVVNVSPIRRYADWKAEPSSPRVEPLALGTITRVIEEPFTAHAATRRPFPVGKQKEGRVERWFQSYPFVSWILLSMLIWPELLLVSLILWIWTYWPAKKWLSDMHGTVFRTFIDRRGWGIGGSAAIAGLFVEWGLLFKADEHMLFLGRSYYNRFGLLGLKDTRGMFSIAGSRSGKGTTAIIPNLLLWKGSVLVIDPKGTNAAVTAARRRAMGQDIHIIDPFDEVKIGETATLNPLEHLDTKASTLREDIQVIADALVVPTAHAGSEHFDEGARTVLSGLIEQLVTDPTYRQNGQVPSLPMIRDLLAQDADGIKKLLERMKANMAPSGLAREAAARILRASDSEEIQNIISNADKHSQWLSSPAMRKVLSTSSFRMSDLRAKPTSSFLVIPPKYLDTHKRFIRLFVNLLLNEISTGGRSKTPVLVLIDEFQQLGRMDEVVKAYRLLAGYNVIVWALAQDFGGVLKLYGKDAEAFLNNSRAVQVFAVQGEDSLGLISSFIGQRSLQNAPGIDSSRTTPLRTPDEAAKEVGFAGDGQYILRSGLAPLLIERVKYYEDSEDKNKGRGWFRRLLGRWAYPFMGLYAQDPDYRK